MKILGWLITFFFLAQLFIELIFAVLSAVLKKKMEKKAKGKDKKIHPDLTKTKKGEQDVKSPETIKQKIIIEYIDATF